MYCDIDEVVTEDVSDAAEDVEAVVGASGLTLEMEVVAEEALVAAGLLDVRV